MRASWPALLCPRTDRDRLSSVHVTSLRTWSQPVHERAGDSHNARIRWGRGPSSTATADPSFRSVGDPLLEFHTQYKLRSDVSQGDRDDGAMSLAVAAARPFLPENDESTRPSLSLHQQIQQTLSFLCGFERSLLSQLRLYIGSICKTTLMELGMMKDAKGTLLGNSNIQDKLSTTVRDPAATAINNLDENDESSPKFPTDQQETSTRDSLIRTKASSANS